MTAKYSSNWLGRELKSKTCCSPLRRPNGFKRQQLPDRCQNQVRPPGNRAKKQQPR
jgi:hypothetical protein